MGNMINIGNTVDKESRQHLSRLIQDVFDSGFKNHMSDTVLVKALDICKDAFAISATIHNCNFTNEAKDDEGE